MWVRVTEMANLAFNKLKKIDVIWLTQIPEYWEIVKVRHLFKESTKKGFPHETLLVASQEHGVVSKDTYGKRTVEATKDLHNLKLVEQGDFVISLRSFQGGIELAHQRGIISPAYTVLKETKSIDKRYFKNLFKSPPFISLMTLCVKGIREGQNIDYPTFKNEFLPFPPIEEQKAIAEYLDKKNNEIDRFIRNKERLIALLEEQKKEIINQCVTLGLDKNVKLKETELGQIPEHWEIRRLGTIGRFSKGGNISRSELTTVDNSIADVSAVLYGDIYTKYDIVADNIVNKISTKTASYSVQLKNGDLLFTGSGETKEDIGKCVLFNSDQKTYAGGDVIIFKQTIFDSHFISYSQNSFMAKYQKYNSAKGEIIVHTYGSKLRDVTMPYPSSIEEQKQIVEFINKEHQVINLAISKAQQEITAIKEYREALITDLVTGKRCLPPSIPK